MFDGAAQETSARIQVRRQGDMIWRDHCFVSGNPESVRNALEAAGGAFPDASVRAVDQYGQLMDYR